MGRKNRVEEKRQYRLEPIRPRSEPWKEFHRICRTSLFKQTEEDYDPDSQDGYFPQPAARTDLLLYCDEIPVGTAELDDFGNGKAAMRMIAVDEARQKQGHGAALGRLLEEFARANGVRELCVNAGARAVGYYERLGFAPRIWSADELKDCMEGRAWPMPVQMTKKL